MKTLTFLEVKRRLKAKDLRLKRVYGITLDEYERILKYQQGRCFICLRLPGRTSLHVDHEHQPKDKRISGSAKRSKVRGLLCWKCNRGLSIYRDEPGNFSRAADYLMQPPAHHILGGL